MRKLRGKASVPPGLGDISDSYQGKRDEMKLYSYESSVHICMLDVFLLYMLLGGGFKYFWVEIKLTNMVQMGWNHQLDYVLFYYIRIHQVLYTVQGTNISHLWKGKSSSILFVQGVC